MAIWFHQELTTQAINKRSENTMVDHCGIEVTKIGDDFLEGTMPVDFKTVQPQRRLHGGASCVLAETLGSIAANCVVDPSQYVAFGIEINASHLRPAIEGTIVTGRATPIKIGKTLQVWEIKIFGEDEKQICLSKLTMAVVKK